MPTGEYSGLVLLVPATRDGWETVTEPVPCLVGEYFHQRAPYEPYYHVDSPYLEIHYPSLATEFGSERITNFKVHVPQSTAQRIIHVAAPVRIPLD